VKAEVLVVGGGPAGSSVAWHLAQLGVEVTMLDRARFPRDKVCAEYLSPQASRILEAMGALPTIEAAGAMHLSGMKVRAPNGREILGHFAAQHGFRGFRDRGLGVRRTVLDATLVDCARRAGVQVLERTHMTDVVRDARGVVTGVQVRDESGVPRTMNASLVIGADGLRSVVGRRLGLTRKAWWPKRIALVAHYRGLPGVTEIGEMHVEANGYVGIADVGHGVTNVAVVVPASRTDGLSGDPAGFFERWVMGAPHLAARFATAERVSEVRVTGPFATAARQAWAPGVALVGDAADFFDPFTGEGVYAALRGGELLAPLAAEYVRSPNATVRAGALPEYERVRRSEFSGKWMVERLIAAFVAAPPLINHAARALSRRTDMADLLIGVAGDFVPPKEVLRFGYLARLLLFGI
jgi:flavin-dependent dehydrogenase